MPSEGQVIVVGIDFQPSSDSALRTSLRLAARGATVHLVHVITRQALDRTGATNTHDKRVLALEQVTRALFEHAERIANALVFDEGEDLDLRSLDLSAQPRIIEAHAARNEEEIARTLAQAGADYGAAQLIIGRHGRPGCVAEHLLRNCRLVSAVGEVPLILEPAQDAAKSARWTTLPGEKTPP